MNMRERKQWEQATRELLDGMGDSDRLAITATARLLYILLGKEEVNPETHHKVLATLVKMTHDELGDCGCE